jgi:isopenicillin N synthase-like dioxygenase
LLLDELTDVPGLAVLLVLALALYLSQNKLEEDLPSKWSVLKLLPFPEQICTKLNFQGMWQQNLNIVADWMSQLT